MLIVRLTGGLGNQMFQYGLFKELQSRGYLVKIDSHSFSKNLTHERFSIKNSFPAVDFPECDLTEARRLGELDMSLISKLRRRILGKKKTYYYEEAITFKNEILNLKGSWYLDGYWQSPLYFEGTKDQLLQEFDNSKLFEELNAGLLLNRLRSEHSVAIHIRKGADFDSASRKETCGKDYYTEAIHRMKTLVSNPRFYVFTDNAEWCRKNLDVTDLILIDEKMRQPGDPAIDMLLMANCKHNIIANSSFSWWAAWLNRHLGKKVITTRSWFEPGTTKYSINDMVPSDWIQI